MTAISCNDSRSEGINSDITVIPIPKEVIKDNNGSFKILNTTIIRIEDQSLLPIANIISDYVKRLTGVNISVTEGVTTKKSIVLRYNDKLSDDEYNLVVDKEIFLEGNSYSSITNAASTLVQLIKFDGNVSYIPNVKIKDNYDFKYRSVMLDLARFWHPIETIKETIDLLWLYKIPYLHLHLSDNKRFTFPLDKFSKVNKINGVGEREYYTKAELSHLVEYAKSRGVAIIPEVDLPGHSAILWNTYPDEFGSLNPGTNKPEQLHVVNIAKEKTYSAVNYIIQELASVFYTSPYIHVGGDEVYLENLKKVPEYNNYAEEKGLKEALKGNVDELFCHFINEMNQMVKDTGKKTIVWEGFNDIGAGNVIVDKDITVIVWNTTYNSPKNLLANGYKIINSTWIPWYMVGAMNLAPSIDRSYKWKITDWKHWNTMIKDVTVDNSSNIFGGQISYWEQNHYKVIPVLRERVPILSERLWNEKPRKDIKDFKNDLVSTNKLYSKLFRPITSVANNLISSDELKFTSFAEIVLDQPNSGSYFWSFSKSWDLPSDDDMILYNKPIRLTESGVLTIQKRDKQGNNIGYPEQKYYQKIEPSYTYKVYGPSPVKGWDSIPDFTEIPLIREGITAKITEERLDKINGELFAKVKRKGHIDTRFSGIYNPYAVELNGIIKVDENERFTLKLQTNDGLANLYLDSNLVVKGTEFNNIPEEFIVQIAAGKHSLKIEYFYKQIQNELNIMYKTEDMQDFAPLEDLIQTLDDYTNL
ncbi:family 20 glycosylhydrolase [Joostella atrarenae]|uniref:beta-N-acetylhexosaminidase n=1 Tax=Joostella atrarenae TaxID=679257 RepID=A0ABS9J520_9FLAO|nr:family 20 glycosylhydrolase [Joostella atrarenae]MCF8715526.1 family 20 glycosylhydrolase [Joostella atrarenae]